LKRARAGVAKARTQVATENALAGYAFKDWKRMRSLNATSGPASDLTLRKPQLAEALAELEAKEADLERATEDLNRTIIRAPYDGMVREKIADVGQYVNTSAQIGRTFAVDFAEVRLPLNQDDLQFLDLPGPDESSFLDVTLRAEIGGQVHAWHGKIVRSEGVFDAQSRVLYVVARVDDPYDTQGRGGEPLRIGTFVTAEIQGRPGGDLFVVPRHALHRGTMLWVVDEGSKIYPREVQIVRSDEKFVYVRDGLSDGERFCTTPIDQPLPGMTVRFNG
jgi:RND family efflux transporter MFP subunit